MFEAILLIKTTNHQSNVMTIFYNYANFWWKTHVKFKIEAWWLFEEVSKVTCDTILVHHIVVGPPSYAFFLSNAPQDCLYEQKKILTCVIVSLTLFWGVL